MTVPNRHIKLHTGSFIEIQRLQLDLNDAEIPFFIKNNNESAKLAGFGSLSDSVELHIFAADLERATNILNALKSELNSWYFLKIFFYIHNISVYLQPLKRPRGATE